MITHHLRHHRFGSQVHSISSTSSVLSVFTTYNGHDKRLVARMLLMIELVCASAHVQRPPSAATGTLRESLNPATIPVSFLQRAIHLLPLRTILQPSRLVKRLYWGHPWIKMDSITAGGPNVADTLRCSSTRGYVFLVRDRFWRMRSGCRVLQLSPVVPGTILSRDAKILARLLLLENKDRSTHELRHAEGR